MKKKLTILLGGIAVGALYMLGRKDGEIQGLKNENKNLNDMLIGQEETIRMLNYALGKKTNRRTI